MPAPSCTAYIATPRHSSGAIAIVHLSAPSGELLDAAIARISNHPVRSGQVVLRDLAGIDRGVIARPTQTCAMCMPHGGALLVRMLAAKLAALGIPVHEPSEADPRVLYPEAQDIFEACALETISRAQSRLAPRVILHQAALWRRAATGDHIHAATRTDSHLLDRLISPPIVAAIGPSNIGKSTLMNALARRSVATVADEPATTRDAVGVSLDLGGLTVIWLDTAGREGAGVGGAAAAQSEIDRVAEAAAARAAETADLVVSCADGSCDYLAPPHDRVIRCATRADTAPRQDADLHTAARGGEGVAELAKLVTQTLLPPDLLTMEALWRFHPALPAPPSSSTAPH